MKAMAKKKWLAAVAGVCAGALAISGVALLDSPQDVTANAAGGEKILYFVDAGNVSSSDDGLGTSPARGSVGYPSKQRTKFMEKYGLTFAQSENPSAEGELYNSVTERCYDATPDSPDSVVEATADPVSGKIWGFARHKDWEDWRFHQGEGDMEYAWFHFSNENGSEDGGLQYKFEVDDATTELKVEIGYFYPSNWDQATIDLKYRVNADDESKVEKDVTATKNVTGKVVLGTEGGESIHGIEDNGKYFVTVDCNKEGKNTALVSYILIATKNYELPEEQETFTFSQFVVKGEDKIKVTSSKGGVQEADLDDTAQQTINAAENLTEVRIDATINGEKHENLNVTVLPQGTQYFVNFGGTGDGMLLQQEEMTFSAEKGHGLDGDSVTWSGTAGWESDPWYRSHRRSNGDSEKLSIGFHYKFDVKAAGAYGVIVGTSNPSGWEDSTNQPISLQNKLVGTIENASGESHGNYYCDVIESSGNYYIKVDVENKKFIVAFILVYKAEKITYDTQGGDALDPDYFDFGTNATVADAHSATKTGYTFGGWYEETGCETSANNKSYSESKTVYAKWTAKEYDVTLDAGDGTLGDDTSTAHATFGQELTITDPTPATGYTFDGWYTQENGEGTKFTSGSEWNIDGEEITLYAHYTPKHYTVTLDYGEAESTKGGEAPASIEVDYNANVAGLPTDLTVDGKIFRGWFTAAEEGTKVENGHPWTYDDVTTLYALFEESQETTVTLNYNGGTPDVTTEVEVNYGEEVVLPEPTKTGYDFGGWYTDEAFEGHRYVSGDVWNESSDVTNLYAKWTAHEYTITFELNEGEGEESMTYTYGVGVPSLPVPTRVGFTFGGWFREEACTGTPVDSIGAEEHEDITLYAKWTADVVEVTVTLNYNGGTPAEPATVTVEVGGEIELPEPTKTGYTFDGWYTAAEGGTKVENGDTWTDEEVTALYARWTAATYTVTFELDGGTLDPATEQYTFGEGLDELPTPTKEGFTFDGWYTAAEDGTKVESIGADETGDKTLYAKWTAVTEPTPGGDEPEGPGTDPGTTPGGDEPSDPGTTPGGDEPAPEEDEGGCGSAITAPVAGFAVIVLALGVALVVRKKHSEK